jgi:hypothetical protein
LGRKLKIDLAWSNKPGLKPENTTLFDFLEADGSERNSEAFQSRNWSK